MIDRRSVLGSALVCGLLVACADRAADDSPVGVTAAALSVCDETVPSDRNVDGIPAYAQCDTAANSAIYSNNGVDTATTSMGADWIKTQYSGGYQCTEFAHRYLHFKWNIDWIPNGNAGEWCDTTPPANSGLVQTTTGVHGDIMVLAPGSCGAAAGTGHVNVIDVVDASGRLTAVEQNRAGRSPYMPSCAKCFLHVVANDGSDSGGTMAPGSGGMGAAGMGASGAGGMGSGGAGAAAGSGGMFAPPMKPAQAGTGAPPPVMPVMPVPMMTAPVMPVPAMTAPVNPAPAAGTGGVSAGSGGAAGTYTFSVPPRRQTQEPGCSVTRPRAGMPRAAHSFGLFALVALLGRSRARRLLRARSIATQLS